MFMIARCCFFGLLSCGIAVWNYRYKQAKMAGNHSADCTGSVYCCRLLEWQLTAIEGFYVISMCHYELMDVRKAIFKSIYILVAAQIVLLLFC